jgi:predicted TIM-barrel fold metal-dependent hydrolase
MFPNVRFLAAHLANPFFTELQNVMKICPNVYTDISGLLVSGTNQDTTHYTQLLKSQISNFIAIDSHRILFGSDFPIQSYEDSINLLNSIHISPADKQLILTKNAQTLLKG